MANLEVYFDSKKSQRIFYVKRVFQQMFLYTFVSIFALFMIVPFWFMIVTSLKDLSDFRFEQATGMLNFFPSEPTWANYTAVFGTRGNFGIYYWNTIIVSVLGTTLTVITTILAAFAFARLEFKGKNFLFMILLATLMIPGEMFIITNFQTALAFEWQNTFRALILVNGVSVFYIFFLRQTFQQIPNELFLAAKVDGYGEFRYLLRVMIPIASPAIVTIVILNLMGAWNAFIWPTLIANGNNPITGQTMRLVANGLMALFQSEFSSEDTVKIAGSMVVTAPLFVFFLIFRKYIMRGVSRSGIKG
jgi:multiple sugar transport system permease protein